MASVALWMQMSLDGFAEGAGREVHWPVVDEELCAPFLDEFRAADAFLYGRETFEIMAALWPTADSDHAISPFYADFARVWKDKPKIVLSRTLRAPGWNTRVIGRRAVDEIAALRSGPGGTVILFGGVETASTCIANDLIDEYRLFVHPILLGRGIPLFPSSVDTSRLRLTDVTTFDSAVVMMRYRPERRDACEFTEVVNDS
ncbi:RibD C-terminal domain [Nocardia otitidiscaviarum]|uniref:RibD C-terminal domain n=1 Tax=Nocardia otitidiscaviarum TaxID=1823 RepID=A0A379JH80_9NOCA|nr:dihydrofolate reductase family protein [Nocardia otitidiscaviarum]SUD47825.1 RibD C-terminal domain [Nocardia otitidiscaviarum]